MDPAFLRRAVGDIGDPDSAERHASSGTDRRGAKWVRAGREAIERLKTFADRNRAA